MQRGSGVARGVQRCKGGLASVLGLGGLGLAGLRHGFFGFGGLGLGGFGLGGLSLGLGLGGLGLAGLGLGGLLGCKAGWLTTRSDAHKILGAGLPQNFSIHVEEGPQKNAARIALADVFNLFFRFRKKLFVFFVGAAA